MAAHIIFSVAALHHRQRCRDCRTPIRARLRGYAVDTGPLQGFGAEIRVSAIPTSPSLSVALRPPQTVSNPVVRHALVARLLACTAPLVVISAPAGSGKTTVLLQWVERDARPHAWLQLGVVHNDPLALVTSFAAALDQIASVDPRLPAGPGSGPASEGTHPFRRCRPHWGRRHHSS